MLDFIGRVITAALILLVVNALTTFMDVSRVAKITLAALIGVWIGLAAAAAGAGRLRDSLEAIQLKSSSLCPLCLCRKRPICPRSVAVCSRPPVEPASSKSC